MAGASLIKAIIGTSLPAKPTSHLPAARPSPRERVLRRKLTLGDASSCRNARVGAILGGSVSPKLRPVGEAREGSSSWETS